MTLEHFILQAAQVLGPMGLFGYLAFYFFDKKDQRSAKAQENFEKTINGIVERHENERKEWYQARDRGDEKVSKAIAGLAEAIRSRENGIQSKSFMQHM